jgi:hypothetical protein
LFVPCAESNAQCAALITNSRRSTIIIHRVLPNVTPENMDLSILSMCIQMANHGHAKPDTHVGNRAGMVQYSDGLLAGWLTDRSSITVREKRLPSTRQSPDWLWHPSSFYPMGTSGCCPEVKTARVWNWLPISI